MLGGVLAIILFLKKLRLPFLRGAEESRAS
jgi:hypothetical protein